MKECKEQVENEEETKWNMLIVKTRGRKPKMEFDTN